MRVAAIESFINWIESKTLADHWSFDTAVRYAKYKGLFMRNEMVCTKTLYNYLHQGKATKTKTSMLELVSQLVSQAVRVGKDIVIEDLVSLDSNKKQEKTTSKYYNRMINNLKFGLFKRCLLSKAPKEGVSVQFVNPYNTSKIAEASYTDRMKLNVHDAASYVMHEDFINTTN